MAKTVGDLLIKLDVSGIEGVSALKGSLRQLGKASTATDQQLEDLKKDILGVAKAGNQSRQSLRGQIDALKGLRDQASLGGKAFKEFSKDIVEYEARLKAVDEQIESTDRKIKSLRQIETGFTAKTIKGLESQIELREGTLSKEKLLTAEYAKQLGGIQALEQASERALARQQVVASAQRQATVRFARGGDVSGGPAAFAAALTEGLGPLPKTINALNLQINELKDELKDLDFTSDDYRKTQQEVLDLEKQLTNATNQRIEAIKGVADQQRRAEQLVERSRGRKQRLLAGQEATAAEYASALRAHQASPAMQVRELSDLYKQVGQISASSIAAQTEMMGKSYRQVAFDIQSATRAGNGNIASLQNQRAAFASLQSVLDPTSRDFREVTKEVEKLDRRLERLSGSTGKGRARLLQGAGAIASAGIFGGPLGALGATAGFIAGGPGGAVLGGGAGATAQALLDQARAVAEYATSLNLAKQTLALAANGQEEYNALLNTSRAISKDYAVGLIETIGGFSQVAVAARANNLTLKDTETIYRGLVASGIAFGKSQQDIDAIITASVQVLSKGRLSAEELQGQIGERLPGAVAKFAEATGRSLPQLAAALKAGEVQISDFVKFAEKQFLDYDEVAQLIGDSPEKAGARLKIALDEAVENFGGFFLRIGAGFQDLFAKIVNFANDNKVVIQNMVVDFIFAAEKIKLVFGKLAADIDRTLGPVLGGIAKMFGKGVEGIYDFVMRERELRAGGFDPEQARKNARQAALNVVPGGEFNVLGMQRAEQEAYRVEMEYARTRGRKVLEGEGQGRVDTSQERRDEIIEGWFGFKPFKFGDFETGKALPDEGSGSKVKDISKAQADAKIASINLRKDEILGLQQRIKLQADLAREAAKLLPEQEQRVELARIGRREANLMKGLQQKAADIGRRMGEDLAKEMQDRRTLSIELQKSLADRQLQLGLISQEEFNQLEIERERARLKDRGASEGQIKEQLDLMRKELAQTPLDKFIVEAKKELTDLETIAVNISQGIGNAVGNALTSGITGLVEGTKKAKEVFADFLQSVGQILAQEGAKIIATYVAIGIAKAFAGLGTSVGDQTSLPGVGMGSGDGTFTNIAGNEFGTFGPNFGIRQRANGGPVLGGQPYIVGERGPELFMPSTSGMVINNNQTRDQLALQAEAMRGNITEDDLPESADAATRKQLASQSDALRANTATRQQLIQQQNNMATNSTREIERTYQTALANPSPLDVRFESRVINNTEYVTAEQHRQGMAQAAEQGRALTLVALQNSVKTRRKVGL